MKEAIQNAIQVVNDSFPSIYTKDDVIRLLMSLSLVEEKPKVLRLIPREWIDNLAERIVEELESEGSDLFDCSDADFDVNVRSDLRLEIDVDGGITLDNNVATTAVEKVIENWIAEHDINTEEEEETPQERIEAYLHQPGPVERMLNEINQEH